jgi:PBSX family phage terminase large subunit
MSRNQSSWSFTPLRVSVIAPVVAIRLAFGGARGPGKSHATFAQVALDDCRRFDGLKALYLRKVGKQAREQFGDLARKVLHSVHYEYKQSAGLLEIWNGSRIFVGHFKDEKDIDNYLGIEYDLIAIEEATTLSQSKYKALRDSNRSSKAGWRPRIYATTNPGGIGHAWFKQRFVTPWQRGEESFTRFISATVDDNVFNDEGYRRRLEENVGWKLRAYRFGDWDIAAGQFFTNFRTDLHVVRPFAWPTTWRHWCALDYGFTHPTMCYLVAQDGDGNIYVIDEHRLSKALVPQHANAIKSMLERNQVSLKSLATFVAGADVFAKRGTTAATIAEQYAEYGIHLSAANDDRINGAGEILQMLGDESQGIPAKLFIFDRCTALIECLPAMEHDPNRPEDVLKVDVDEDGNGGDDPYDGLRYAVMAGKRTSAGTWGTRKNK